jgi:drug/metabolite transporter (DMT)-like permease
MQFYFRLKTACPEMALPRKVYVYAGLVLSSIFWGANFHFAKIAVNSISPVIGASYRFIIAALLLIAILCFSAPVDWRLLKKHFLIYVLLALFGVFGYNLLFFNGMKTTSTVTGALINATNPLMTVLISRFILKTRLQPLQIAGIALSFAGILGIISKGNLNLLTSLNFVTGDLYILGATLLFGFFNVYTRKYLSGVSPILTTTAITSIAALMFMTLLVVQNTPLPLYEVSTSVWLAIVCMSVFGSVLAYIFWNKGLNEIGANKTAAFTNLVPLSAALISIGLGEKISSGQIVGGVFIISGVIISSYSKS